jgi:hypothetical protein
VPKYFFHVYDGDVLIVRDTQGVELLRESAAVERCARIVRAVLEEADFAEAIAENRAILVVDENDRVLVTVPFQ